MRVIGFMVLVALAGSPVWAQDPPPRRPAPLATIPPAMPPELLASSLRAIETASDVFRCLVKLPVGWLAFADSLGSPVYQFVPPARDLLSTVDFSAEFADASVIAEACDPAEPGLTQFPDGDTCFLDGLSPAHRPEGSQVAVSIRRWGFHAGAYLTTAEGLAWTADGRHGMAMGLLDSEAGGAVGEFIPRPEFSCEADERMDRMAFITACRTFIEANTLDQRFGSDGYCAEAPDKENGG